MVDSFTSTDARCIAESQEQFAKSCVTRDLTYILSNLAFLPMTITSLEEQGLPLDKALTLINNTKARLESCPGPVGRALQAKMESLLSKNPGLETVQKVQKAIAGEGDLPNGMSPLDVAQMKYLPTASVDVERSFSLYKNVLSDRRQCLTEENLSMILVVQCFFNRGQEDK